MKRINLMLGDCLERMKEIESGTVDMILCDLPYGTTCCSWDSVIPLELLWVEYERVIKPNGAIVLFAQPPFSFRLGNSNLAMFKYQWTWIKSNSTGHLNSGFAPLKKHENILVFAKSAACYVKNIKNAMQYNPQGIRACKKINRRKKGCELYDTKFEVSENIALFENYPTDVLSFNVERGLHPTQKPVALCEYLVRTYTNQGDIVLDNTMGSGTTGVACVNLYRNFIGIEQEQKYFEIANERIATAVKERDEGLKQKDLFGGAA